MRSNTGLFTASARLRGVSLAALAVATIVSVPAYAAAAEDQPAGATAQAPSDADSTIVVTGTRRTDRTVAESSVPVDVFTADDFKAQPAPQLQTILQTLVPSFNQQRNLLGDASAFVRPPTLRGLPADQILVLVNGKRMHRSALVQVAAGALNAGAQGADLSQISAPALGRVEVLRDGAAAQYGSDAIAGVINLGLRRDSEGLEVTARYGQTYRGDGQDTQLTAFWGTKLGEEGGFFNVTGEFIDQNIFDRSVARPVVPPLLARGITTDFPTGNRLGGPENRAYRVVYNMEMPAGDTTFYSFGNYGWQRQGNDFNLRHPVSIVAADNVTPVPGRPTSGVIGRSVNPVFLDRVGVDANGVARWDANGAQFNINDSAAFPEFRNGFVPFFGATNEDLGLVGGFKGTELGLNYDVSLMYGQNEIRYFMSDTINASLGPDTPTDFYMGKLVQREFNFNADFNTSKEIGLAEPLFIAFGVEVRREAYEVGLGDSASWQVGQFTSQNLYGCTVAGVSAPCSTPGASAPTQLFNTNGTPRVSTALPGSNGFQGFGPDSVTELGRNNYSAYLDFEATVVEGLDVGVAARYDYFNDFGSTFNGKISARWAINDAIALRGAASTGFRAPTPGQQATQNLTTGFPFGSVVPLGVVTARGDSELGQFYQAQPLRPEKSVNFSAGVVLTPGSGFNVTLDLYQITVRDRIGVTSNINVAGDRATLVALGIPGAAELGAVRYFTNAFRTRTRGGDMVIQHRADTDFGLFNTSLAVNYNRTNVTDFTRLSGATLPVGLQPSFEPINGVTRFNIANAVPRWRAVLSETFTKDIFDLTARLNYFGGFASALDPQTGTLGPTPSSGINTLAEAQALYPQQPGDWTRSFGAQASLDLEVGVTLEERYRIAVGAQNLLNTFPERETRNIYPDTGGALNGSIYSDFAPIGQMGGFWYVRASARF